MTELKLRTASFVIDAVGAYPIAPDSIFARAPKTKQGRFDLRTKLGREAQKLFLKNQHKRIAELEALI